MIGKYGFSSLNFIKGRLVYLWFGLLMVSTGCMHLDTTKENIGMPYLPSGTAKGIYKDAPSPQTGLNFRRTYFGIARQSDLDFYLNEVLARLQKAYTDIPKPAHVFVVPDSSYVANSTEDGAIFVPYGLLIDMESEDELAALLAHEYSHILKDHHVTRDAEKSWNVIHGAVNIAQRFKLLDQSIWSIVANEAALKAVQTAVIPIFDRDQEDEADKLGTDLLIAAGYNSQGMYKLLGRMVEWENKNLEQNSQREMSLAPQTHMATTPNKIQVNFDFNNLLNSGKKKLGGIIEEVGKGHFSAKDRQDIIREYIKTVHSQAIRPRIKLKEWSDIKQKTNVASFLDGLSLMRQASKDKVDSKEAKKLVDRVISTQAKDVPYVHFNAFIVYKSVGLEKEALIFLKNDANSKDSLLPEHLELIATAEKISPKEGLKYALAANEILGEPTQLIPKLIQLQKKSGNTTAVSLLHAKCLTIGISDLMSECDKEAN